MKLGIMQPYFFPYLGYWQLLNAVDEYVIYDDVNYIKRGYVNRNSILCDGKALLITLPLIHPSQNRLISQTKICCEELKTGKLLKTIQQCYAKAPFFAPVFSMIVDIFETNQDNLAQFLTNSIKKTANYLGIQTKLRLSSDLAQDRTRRGKDRVLNICENLGATEYYNAIGGTALYDRTEFAEKGIQLRFLKMKEGLSYPQYKTPFVPNLSIIDIMMFNHPDEIGTLLTAYTLV